MKKLFLLFFALSIFSACEKEDAPEELVIRVKDNKVSCSGYEGQTDCYLVQKGNMVDTEEWEYFYEQIQGFDYEEGFVYKLLVRKEAVQNPPMDAPHVKYTLIRELSADKTR